MQPFVAPKERRRKMNGGCTDGLPRGNAVGSGGNRSTTATAGFRFSAGLTVPPALLLAWVGLLEGADDVAGDLTTDGDLVAVVACPQANQSVADSVTRRGRGATLPLRRHPAGRLDVGAQDGEVWGCFARASHKPAPREPRTLKAGTR